MWELDHKESWAPKTWCFWTVVLEKTLESPLDCKVIQSVHPKRDQSWVFIGRTDAKAETAIVWLPDVKKWLIWKDPDAGKDWGQEEKGTAEDEMVGWHHWLNGHEFEQTLGVGDGQEGLVCCCPRGRKELDTTERLNWTECFTEFNGTIERGGTAAVTGCQVTRWKPSLCGKAMNRSNEPTAWGVLLPVQVSGHKQAQGSEGCRLGDTWTGGKPRVRD